MNKTISVIIPVYNGEKTLENCLNSICQQSRDNYEVIVVNNGSTDNSEKIIRLFQKKYDFLEYIYVPDRSRSIARNAGINKSKGEIIVTTDCDCVYPANWLNELTAPIRERNEQAVIGSEEDLVKNYWTKNIQSSSLKFLKRNLNGRYINHIDTKNFAVKANIIKNNLFDPKIKYMEDFDLFLRLHGKVKIFFQPSAIVGHQHRSNFVNFFKMNFERARWVYRICKKNKTISCEHPMAESMGMKNNLLFPLWIIYQSIKKPKGEYLFLVVSEFSWRLGLLWEAIIKKNS